MAASFTQNYVAVGLLCLLAGLSFPNAAEAGYTMNDTCVYLQKGYIADPSNCQNWGYCQNGELIQTGSCGNGFLYDSTSGTCNYASQVQCLTSTQDMCNKAVEPQYIGDPNNCNGYCYCSNKQLQCFNCPQYQVYSPTYGQCVWSSTYNCPANSICRLVQNNQFVGDPNICGNYIRCTNGAGNSTSCPGGYGFNPRAGGCQFGYSQCSSAPGENPPTNNGPPLTDSKVCQQYVTPAQAPAPGSPPDLQYFSDNQTCYGYYSCDKYAAKGVWGSCLFATHFDPTTQICVTPYTYDCPYNRCGNIAREFMAVKGCLEYTYCVNQVNITSQACAVSSSAFPYYDEYYGVCVEDPPPYTICQT